MAKNSGEPLGEKINVRNIKLDTTDLRLIKHLAFGTFGGRKMEAARRGQLVWSHSFTGEKNYGEFGPTRSYLPDYQLLRYRSWQAYLESDVAQIAINRLATWVIGEGLKLQSEPSRIVLQALGINVGNIDKFSKTVEAFYMLTKNEKAMEAFVNSIVGGDVLTILRYDKDKDSVTIELIDGAHVCNPQGYGDEVNAHELPNGNRIEHGIELSPSNEHIAFWVKNSNLKYERIPAKTGDAVTAFLVYGSKYRLDTHRGMPLISVVLERIRQLERYSGATLGSAEERAKIPYFIEHELGSTGENPMVNQIVKIINGDTTTGGEFSAIDTAGNEFANLAAATYNKMMINMPINSTMKAIEHKAELYFKDFYQTHQFVLFACIGIPPNVALQQYNDSYSASRAAIMDWQHTLTVRRAIFSNQFERPVFTWWMFIETVRGTFKVPSLLKAWAAKRWIIVEAFLKARFVGASVPHIDPLKEVQAERLKLGETGAALPLTTLEQATESLGLGDSAANMEQYANELTASKKLKIEVPEPAAKPVPGGQAGK
jgi:hypothetical protein